MIIPLADVETKAQRREDSGFGLESHREGGLGPRFILTLLFTAQLSRET